MHAWPGRQRRGLAIGARRLTLDIDTFGPPPAGPYGAPTLVFLHEGLGSIALWRDVPHELSCRAGLGVLTFSRQGYGDSDVARLPRGVRYMHDEVPVLAALLKDLAVERPILVGHSDGASIALLYAGSAALRGDGPEPIALLLEAPHVFVEEVTVASIAAARADRQVIVPRLQRHHAVPAEDVFDGWADIWLSPEFRRWDIRACLPDVTVPTLVVQGADDAYGTWAQVDAIAAGVRGRFHAERLERCGHSPHRDQGEQTLAVMTRFLREAWPGSSGPRRAPPP